MRARPIILTLLVSGVIGCYASTNGDYYTYDYPWGYNRFGTYTVVRRPVYVVDGWTNRAFGYRPYRGYRVRRTHDSPIKYTATKKDETLEVNLIEMGDSTRVEVQARKGKDKWEKEKAKSLMGEILKEYKK